MFFLWRQKKGLKFLWLSVGSCFIILHPASGPADSRCLSSSAAVPTVHRSIHFLPCPHTKQTYQPLSIPCHELGWKTFGISSVLHESFYKRITLPIGDHVGWFLQSGALSSPVWQCKAFLTAPVAYVTRIRNFHCCSVSYLCEAPASEKTVIQLWTKTSRRDTREMINHGDSEVHFYLLKYFVLI